MAAGHQRLMSIRISDGHMMKESGRCSGWIAEEISLLSLVALAATEERSVVEHVLCHGIQSPIVSLAGIARFARDLDETVVETEIVSDRILPGWESIAIVRESIHDELADAAQCELLVRSRKDGHRYEGDVRIRRFY